MKFFTPELLALSRSPDEDVADKADTDWDEATERYWEHNQQIHAHLVAGGVPSLEDKFSLYEADLLGFHISLNGRWVALVIRLANGRKLRIRYEIGEEVGGFSVKPQPAVKPPGPTRLVILHDEFDWDEVNRCLTHSILLNGMEIIVRFASLQMQKPVKRKRVKPVIPIEVTWQQAQAAQTFLDVSN